MSEALENLLGEHAVSIQQEVIVARQQETAQAVDKLKSTLPALGRCPVCTLKVPCKHYSQLETISKPPTETKKRPAKYRSFSINKRSASPVNKLEALERLEAYRESKLQKEIQKIEDLEVKAARQKQEEMKKENVRLKHMTKQKEKLKKYKAELAEKITKFKEGEEKEKRRLVAMEKCKLRQVEERNKKLRDLHEKKRKTQKEKGTLQEGTAQYDYSRSYLNSSNFL